jgi:uncharacterized protein
MLAELYPQKWLPYRYLWPFLWNYWDSEEALRSIASYQNRPSVLIVQAEKDEVIPADQTNRLEALCKDLGLDVAKTVVPGALHTEVLVKGHGRRAIEQYLLEYP